MNDRKISVQLGIGIPSILMMFVIVIMCIISVLCYLDATSYYQSTYKQANITESYYNAQSQGLEIYYSCENKSENEIKELLIKNDIDFIIDDNVIEYYCDMNDEQYLLFRIDKDDYSLLTMKQCNREDSYEY